MKKTLFILSLAAGLFGLVIPSAFADNTNTVSVTVVNSTTATIKNMQAACTTTAGSAGTYESFSKITSVIAGPGSASTSLSCPVSPNTSGYLGLAYEAFDTSGALLPAKACTYVYEKTSPPPIQAVTFLINKHANTYSCVGKPS